MNIKKIIKIADILLIECGIVYLIAWKTKAHTLLTTASYSMLIISMIVLALIFTFDDHKEENKDVEKTS